jgi:hypothetical protein
MKVENEGISCPASNGGLSKRPMLVHHVAKLTGYSRRNVRHLAQTGQLPGSKLGKKIWGFDRTELRELGYIHD